MVCTIVSVPLKPLLICVDVPEKSKLILWMRWR